MEKLKLTKLTKNDINHHLEDIDELNKRYAQLSDIVTMTRYEIRFVKTFGAKDEN